MTTAGATPNLFTPSLRSNELAALNEIARLIRNRQLTFLLGSGASFSSGLPMGDALAGLLLDRVAGPDLPPGERKRLLDKYSLDAIGAAFYQEMDGLRLQEALEALYETTNPQPTAVHRNLAYLADRGYLDKIYTTNFDGLLEAAINDRAISITDANYSLLSRPAEQKRFPIIHLHGTTATNPLIRESETYRLNTPLGMILTAEMFTRWFLFLGYSMNDVDLRSIHFATTSMLGPAGTRTKNQYAVHPAGSEYEHALATRVWEGRGVRYIDADADSFTELLVHSVEEQRERAIAEAILRKRERDPNDPAMVEALLDEARTLVTGIGYPELRDALLAMARRYEVSGINDL